MSEDNFEDNEAEEEPVYLSIENGVAKLQQEPFTTISVMTEEDFESLKLATEIKKHIMNCSTCAGIGWSNCKFFRTNLDKKSKH